MDRTLTWVFYVALAAAGIALLLDNALILWDVAVLVAIAAFIWRAVERRSARKWAKLANGQSTPTRQ